MNTTFDSCQRCGGICHPMNDGVPQLRCNSCNHISLPLGDFSDIPKLEPVPFVEEPKKSQPRAVDIFAPTYPRTIESVFKTLVPKEKTMTFSLLQALYAENPDRFRVISGIHQNSFEDKLHLSLAVDCGKSSYTLHIYGFWKNYFRVGAVTMKETDDVVHTIATF